jgi:hypothetical protein
LKRSPTEKIKGREEKMKKLLAFFIGMVMVFGIGGMASATPFTDTEDFSGDGNFGGRTYNQISDTENFSYTHNITFSPPAELITLATLTISHAGNNSEGWFANEVWFITDQGETKLADLSDSYNLIQGNYWVDQAFTLPPSLYSAISGGSWSITFKLKENTGGTDYLYLDKSVLSGQYTPSEQTSPVPEPATMLLLGSGLIGLAGFARRKFKK